MNDIGEDKVRNRGDNKVRDRGKDNSEGEVRYTSKTTETSQRVQTGRDRNFKTGTNSAATET
jgi:hypothetical protein